MSSENDNKALLQQLRIDRTESAAEASAPRRYGLIGAALAVLLVLLGALWFTFGRTQALPVHVAAARPIPGGAAASASVLDATGYVTARREATVSAQITGTITAVLIEEGDHVKDGQVIGRLDDTAQRAALTQAQAALHSAQSQLTQDQVQLAQSLRDLKRAEDLVEAQPRLGSRRSSRPAPRSMRRARRWKDREDRSIWPRRTCARRRCSSTTAPCTPPSPAS